MDEASCRDDAASTTNQIGVAAVDGEETLVVVVISDVAVIGVESSPFLCLDG